MFATSPNDDGFLIIVRFAPILFVVAGIVVVLWMNRQRLPAELEPDVLEALSETEALPTDTIRQRPPLAQQDVDLGVLEYVLNQLCTSGRAVRWYDGNGEHTRAVYRRVKSVPVDGCVR